MSDERQDTNPVSDPSESDISPARRRVPARITVVETIYYQPGDGSAAIACESRFNRWLESTDDQPYIRHLKVTPEWQPLGASWLGNRVSYLCIRNDGNAFLEVTYHAEAKYVAILPPRESIRLIPAGIDNIRVRCPATIIPPTTMAPVAETRCTIYAFPR